MAAEGDGGGREMEAAAEGEDGRIILERGEEATAHRTASATYRDTKCERSEQQRDAKGSLRSPCAMHKKERREEGGGEKRRKKGRGGREVARREAHAQPTETQSASAAAHSEQQRDAKGERSEPYVMRYKQQREERDGKEERREGRKRGGGGKGGEREERKERGEGKERKGGERRDKRAPQARTLT